MAYCSRCGVEVEERAPACPLCEAPIQRLEEPRPEDPRYPESREIPGRQARYLVWLVFTAVLLSVVLATMALDFVFGQTVSWSLYPLTGAGFLWAFITLVVIFARRPVIVIAGQAPATAGFLIAIDLFDGRLEWFVPLALPIVAIVTSASILVWVISRLTRRAPAMTASAVLLGCGGGSVALDLLISGHLGATSMSWSLIVLGAVLPPTAFLLYYHLRLRRRIDLARFLHT